LPARGDRREEIFRDDRDRWKFVNFGGVTNFTNTSTAGNASINNNFGGRTEFFRTSSGGNATISNSGEGSTVFTTSSSAENATIQNADTGVTLFQDTSTAGRAAITNNSGGSTTFSNTSSAASATITTNSGGSTFFAGASNGSQARLITNAGGTVDISMLSVAGMTAGSIEGAGTYLLGSKQLTVGVNDLSTRVSGTISDEGVAGGVGGSLVKVGSGTLVLTGTNTYTGGTTIEFGTLQIGNGETSGSIARNVVNFATLAFNRSNPVTFGGQISGIGALIQMGSGLLTLAADNTYGGTITINSGTTLQLGNGGTTGSITGNVTDNGLLIFNRLNNVTYNGVISGFGSVYQNGSGTTILDGANTFFGFTVINTWHIISEQLAGFGQRQRDSKRGCSWSRPTANKCKCFLQSGGRRYPAVTDSRPQSW
jgi:autotransporter-associated beta strand protein